MLVAALLYSVRPSLRDFAMMCHPIIQQEQKGTNSFIVSRGAAGLGQTNLRDFQDPVSSIGHRSAAHGSGTAKRRLEQPGFSTPSYVVWRSFQKHEGESQFVVFPSSRNEVAETRQFSMERLYWPYPAGFPCICQLLRSHCWQ
jgi:hypothetical protein